MIWKLGTNGVEQETTYSYDDQGRLQTASLGAMSASYTFQPAAPHPVAKVTRPLTGAAEALIGTLGHNAVGRPEGYSWATQQGAVSSFGAQYDAASRRTHIQREGGITQRYGYNDRGEVTSSWKEATATAQTLDGWTQGFSYDDIGNRTQSTTPEGETLMWETEWPGESHGNVYYRFDLPQKHFIRVRTKTPPPVINSVTIDGQTAVVDGDWWRALVDTSTWYPHTRRTINIAVNASAGGTTQTSTQQRVITNFGNEYAQIIDDDGNCESFNDMRYGWDAQNRLVLAESISWPWERGRTAYDYDAYGRRIRKRHAVKVLDQWWNPTWLDEPPPAVTDEEAWPLKKETVFVWDGWTLLGEYERTSPTAPLALRRSYLWGLDLVASSSEQSRIGAAGGVGGLLWVNDFIPGQSTSFRQLAPWYDLNGNVMGWMENSAAGSRVLHRQEYDAFGQLVIDDTLEPALTPAFQAAGATNYLDRPPIGFSTKYEDAETGLLYYGYRYYSPELGRWLSRDPIAEEGGLNLYAMVGNDAVNRVDQFGLVTLDTRTVKKAGGTVGEGWWSIQWIVNGSKSGTGTITQDIRVKWDIRTLTGEKKRVAEAHNKLREHWYWKAGGIYADPWHNKIRNKNDVLCTNGTLTVTGSATFWEGKDLPPNSTPIMPSQRPDPGVLGALGVPAFALPNSFGGGKPGGWFAKKSNTVKRTLRVKWDWNSGTVTVEAQ